MEHGIVYWIQIALLFGIPAIIIIRILYLFLHDMIIYHKIAKQNYKNLYLKTQLRILQ